MFGENKWTVTFWPARRWSLHLAGVIPVQGGRGRPNKRQASSSLVISWEAGRPLLPNWHRLTANKGFLPAWGNRLVAPGTAVTSSPLSPERLTEVAQGTPDPLMKEMGSWCLFNENNKAHEQTAPQALLFKERLGRMDGGLHLNRLGREIRSVLIFSIILFLSHLCIIFPQASERSDVCNNSAGLLSNNLAKPLPRHFHFPPDTHCNKSSNNKQMSSCSVC